MKQSQLSRLQSRRSRSGVRAISQGLFAALLLTIGVVGVRFVNHSTENRGAAWVGGTSKNARIVPAPSPAITPVPSTSPAPYPNPVSDTPSDNLLTNEWFSIGDCLQTLSPWGQYISFPWPAKNKWSLSSGPGIPSPAFGCQTAAYVATPGSVFSESPNAEAGKTLVLFQEVDLEPYDNNLNFDMHWMGENVELAQVDFLIWAHPQMGWEVAWTPFLLQNNTFVQPPTGQGEGWLWQCSTQQWAECANNGRSLGFYHSGSIPGADFYKYGVLVKVKLPPGGNFKFTGMYLSANDGS